MDLILVPKGTTSAENGSITVTKDFYIGKYEVTQKQWNDVMQGNNNNISTMPGYGFGEGDSYPVYNVRWYDSLVFCNRLSRLENLTPVYSIKGTTDDNLWGTSPTSLTADWNNVIVNESADGYRLPMSNEWEYAARGGAGGSTTTYAGSNNIGSVSWYESNSGFTSHSVGTKLPNELGIYDMSGNIYEWCYDWDPENEGLLRALRGGSWIHSSSDCTVSYDYYIDPYFRDVYIGLRVCRFQSVPNLDTTPPSFSSVNIDTITQNTVTLNANVNEDSTAYYKVLARNATPPTSAELKASHDGAIVLTANITSIQPITSLTSSTQYDLYIVVEDTAGNTQTEPTKLSFNTAQMNTQVMLQDILTYIKAQIDNHPSGLAKSIQSWNVNWTMAHSPTAFETTVCNEWLGAKLGQAYVYDIALAILFLNSAKSMGYDVEYRYITGIADGAIEAINSNNGIVPFSYILYPNGVYECSGNFTGASAWLGLALSKLSDVDTKYRIAAENIFNSIYTLQNTLNIDYTSILIKGGVGKDWASTEHNIDFWYLCNSLYKITKNMKYKNIRDKIKNGILKNWDDTNKVFKRGYNDDVKTLDCASWGSAWLYNIGDTVKGTQCLAYASNFACNSTNYSSITGYHRGEENYNSNSVWVEGSAGVIYSKLLYAQDYNIDLSNQEKLYELADNYFLYSSDTYEILDDSMLRAPAIASYGWMGLVYLSKPDAFYESPGSPLEEPKDPKNFFWEGAVEYGSKDIKISAGLYSSAISSAYYNGYFDKMAEDGLNTFSQNNIYINPNVLPKIYEYGIEINGTSYQTNLQIPLLPQEEKEIYIENYIMPESSSFNTSGLISDIEKYYGKYGTENNSTLPYNHEMYLDGDITKYFPFNLLTDKIYHNKNGNIVYKDFNNGNIEFHFLPSDKSEYMSKIYIKNKLPEQSSYIDISPIFVTSSIIQVSVFDYNNIKLGNVLKLNPIHAIPEDNFHTIYEQNKNTKYTIIGMNSENGSYYITLDKIYPYLLDNGKYMSSILYTSDIIHLNYLSIRGNPLIYKNGTYSSEDKYSIEKYGEKTYSLKTGLFSLEYLNRLSNVLINERKSVTFDDVNKIFLYDKKLSKFIAEFSYENYTLSIGDIIYITEDCYYNMEKEPFMIIKISRTSSQSERNTKFKAISLNLIKDKFVNELTEIETSSIKSISVLDPTDYLTDKTLLNTTYTDDFGVVYSVESDTASIKEINGNEITITNYFISVTKEIVVCINDKYYNTINMSDDVSTSKLMILGDMTDIKIGDIVYIYKKISSPSSRIEVSYKTGRSSNKLYLSWSINQIYEKVELSLFEVNSYDEAYDIDIDTGTPIKTYISKGEKEIIGSGYDFNHEINSNKYYVIMMKIFFIDGTSYQSYSKNIYSPSSSITIE